MNQTRRSIIVLNTYMSRSTTTQLNTSCNHQQQQQQQQQQHHYHQTKNILLCPGQSSQHIGMLKHAQFTNNSHLRNLTQQANDILGYDIVDLCEKGPIESLNRTVYCQPAVVVASMLAFEKLKQERRREREVFFFVTPLLLLSSEDNLRMDCSPVRVRLSNVFDPGPNRMGLGYTRKKR